MRKRERSDTYKKSNQVRLYINILLIYIIKMDKCLKKPNKNEKNYVTLLFKNNLKNLRFI